ncbi:MAG: molybdopterin-guanine dinucleotide biosynthesis protein B [Actinomycetota bacterium]|nr:molybdopterin-guanine dinucleotide biosynthesis protein B [Actinomycetota bacterium]
MSTGEPLVPPIVSVVARSKTGKTTFLEALLPALKEAGLRVAVVKHHHHTSSFDTPGKDTHRIAEAGADLVLGISPVQVAAFSREAGSKDLDAVIARHCAGYDLVLTEGYKRGGYPKIEVHRAERSDELLCDFDEMLALVTDSEWDTDVPQFSLSDAGGLAKLLANWLESSSDAPGSLDLQFNVWLESEGEVAASRWRMELLSAVDEHGSITAGAEAMGVPYRVAWKKIHEMEERLGEQLLETQTGGPEGGGARLTDAGRDRVDRMRVFCDRADRALHEISRDVFGAPPAI